MISIIIIQKHLGEYIFVKFKNQNLCTLVNFIRTFFAAKLNLPFKFQLTFMQFVVLCVLRYV